MCECVECVLRMCGCKLSEHARCVSPLPHQTPLPAFPGLHPFAPLAAAHARPPHVANDLARFLPIHAHTTYNRQSYSIPIQPAFITSAGSRSPPYTNPSPPLHPSHYPRMAKSLRSKSKRAFRRIKREDPKSDYAIRDKIRLQRLNEKLKVLTPVERSDDEGFLDDDDDEEENAEMQEDGVEGEEGSSSKPSASKGAAAETSKGE